MIGKVTWGNPETGDARTAVLHEGLRWETPGHPEEAERLETLYADWPTGPWAGSPGHAQLNDLARITRGTVEFEPKAPDPPGTVY